MSTATHIAWFADLDAQSEHLGRQSKHLARLTQAKFPLLPGFVIQTGAYYDFLRDNKLEHRIKQLLSTVALDRPDSLMQGEYHIKQLFEQAVLSDKFIDELTNFCELLGNEITLEVFENGKKHQHISEANELTKQIKDLWAQMFAGNALWHRHQQHLDHFGSGAEIIVRKKIPGDKTGTIVTIDPHTYAKDKLLITLSKPHEGDQYVLSKKNLSIIDRTLKQITQTNKLSLDEILAIAKMAKRLEEYLYFPQEISWIIVDNKLHIAEIKPITNLVKQHAEKKNKLPVARGKGLTTQIGTGFVHIIHSSLRNKKIQAHDIVILSEINAKQLPFLKKAGGLIIESSLPHGETTYLLKQFGMPTISNVKNATKQFRNSQIITIHGGKGEIYKGGLL